LRLAPLRCPPRGRNSQLGAARRCSSHQCDARFGDTVGRVVTVNYNGRAIVDFQDGGWYDIPASEEHLVKLEASEASKYKNVNSAQVIPDKQG